MTGTGYFRRPARAQFIPMEPPESADAKCLHGANNYDMAVNGFVVDGGGSAGPPLYGLARCSSASRSRSL